MVIYRVAQTSANIINSSTPKRTLTSAYSGNFMDSSGDLGPIPSEDYSIVARTESIVGTVEYMAPEVLIMFGGKKIHKDGYTAAVDFWSLGVLIFKLLTGNEPFNKMSYPNLQSLLPTHIAIYGNYREAFDRIFGTVNYNAWSGILTDNGVSLIQGLLEFNPESRLGYCAINAKTGHDALMNHPFFTSIDWSLLESKQLPPPYVPNEEILEIMRETVCVSKPFPELMRNANKKHWCENFKSSSSSNNDTSPAKNCMKVHTAAQYYFRMWNYANPKYNQTLLSSK